MPTMIDFNLYLITNRRQVAGRNLIGTVRAALQGGVRAVQLREKDLSARELLLLARELRQLTHEFDAKLLINDRIDVALTVEADGVHLGGGSLPVVETRAILGPTRLIGLSTHHVVEIADAARGGADFVTFGPIWYTPSKAGYGSPVGLETLRTACAASPLPVFALGGITPARIPQLIAVGCRHAACIGAVLTASHPERAAAAFVSQLDAAKTI